MSDVDARYLGLTANQLAMVATDLKAEVLTLRMENAELRKECDTLCRRTDELCMENEKLRELMRDMVEWAYIDSTCDLQEQFADRLHELGVDDA